jgi:5'-deoxynucleotidase YfbR-like HD superfamily hydrolase
VKRWIVIKTIRDQNVAEHSFVVAIIALELLIRFNLLKDDRWTLEVLVWALMHDAPEVLTGDIDGKFKRDYDSVRAAVTEAEHKSFPWYRDIATGISSQANTIVKLADKMESIHFIRQWGTGGRADDVRRELEALLFTEMVPKAATVLDIDEDTVEGVVRHVLDHSLSETNSVQLRRYRALAEGE